MVRLMDRMYPPLAPLHRDHDVGRRRARFAAGPYGVVTPGALPAMKEDVMTVTLALVTGWVGILAEMGVLLWLVARHHR
jgi:hypothetical protein